MSGAFGEPWRVGDTQSGKVVASNVGIVLLKNMSDEMADRKPCERAVACVNGCSGIADPSKIAALIEAARAVVEKWEQAKPHLDSMAVLAQIHGMPYAGPVVPVDQLAAALDLVEAKP